MHNVNNKEKHSLFSSKYSTKEQFTYLVEQMKRRPYLAKGPILPGADKDSWDEEWGEIRDKLNALGPPCRPTAVWKRVWIDLKARTKKKLYDRGVAGDKGVGMYEVTLTHIEQEVADLLNLLEATATSKPVERVVEKRIVKRRKIEDEYMSLLQQQTVNQELISDVLDRIAATMENFLANARLSQANQENTGEYFVR